MGVFDFWRSKTINADDLTEKMTTHDLANAYGMSSGSRASLQFTAYDARRHIEDVMSNNIGYMCVRAAATALASVDLVLYDNEKEIVDRNHPIRARLDQPNPTTSQAAMLAAISSSLDLTGNAYVLRRVATQGPIGYRRGAFELHVLRPDRVRPIHDLGRELPERFEVTSENGQITSYPVDPVSGACDVLQFKFYNPLNDYLGFPPAAAAYAAIQTFKATEEYNLKNMRTGGMSKWVAALKPARDGTARNLTKEQAWEMADRIKAHVAANGTNSVLAVSGDWELHNLNHNPEDLDFLSGQREAARNIARAFGIPPIILSIEGDNTYNNVKEARLDLFTSKVLPQLDQICSALTVWMKRVWGDNLRIGYDIDSIAALEGAREAKFRMVGLASDILTLNERRDFIGYAPIAGGDDLPSKPAPAAPSPADPEDDTTEEAVEPTEPSEEDPDA